MAASAASAFPAGTHARVTDLKQRADLNGEYAISLGAAGDRVKILLDTGVEMALKAENLRKVDVFPGARVSIVGLKNAAHLNGMVGIVDERKEERFVVQLHSSGECKALKADNLIMAPARKREREDDEMRSQQLVAKKRRMEDACADPEELQALIESIPEVAMKAVCLLGLCAA